MVKFENGVGVDYSEFESKFATPEFEKVDLVYYFHSVSDWSDQKNMKLSLIHIFNADPLHNIPKVYISGVVISFSQLEINEDEVNSTVEFVGGHYKMCIRDRRLYLTTFQIRRPSGD